MFGTVIKKFCKECDKEVKETVTVLYIIEGNDYVSNFNCPTCSADLAVEDRNTIIKAREEGKPVSIAMT